MLSSAIRSLHLTPAAAAAFPGDRGRLEGAAGAQPEASRLVTRRRRLIGRLPDTYRSVHNLGRKGPSRRLRRTKPPRFSTWV